MGMVVTEEKEEGWGWELPSAFIGRVCPALPCPAMWAPHSAVAPLHRSPLVSLIDGPTIE